jgi:hypothetical protein
MRQKDVDMLHATLGKGFGPAGSFCIGDHYGTNERLFVDATGATKQAGVPSSWTGPDIKVGLTSLDAAPASPSDERGN